MFQFRHLIPLFFTTFVAGCGSHDGPVTDVTPEIPADVPSAAPTAPAPPAASEQPPAASPDAGTKPSEPEVPAVRFIAMGDTGTGSKDQKRVANTIEAKCVKDGCDFIQLLGDNLYDSGASSVDDPVWESHFETPYAAIDLPFFAVLGNHDYGADGAGTDFPKGNNEVAYTLHSTKWKMPAAYYHHAHGPLEVFALDTNMQLFGQDAAQRTAVNGWISASTAQWKIAVGHHPYKSNGPHGNAGDYDGVVIPGPWKGTNVKSFMDDEICGKVDLYLSGHDHSRQWLNVSCKGTELAVSGAGAKATELPGNNPALFQSLELGFLYIVVEAHKLTAEFIDDNGEVEFTHVIQK